jgi:murein DD-endopeptidase MepM/ murein hydrolase activator NlpD
MNYHYYSPLHKRKKTNNSMLFATDIIKVKEDKRGFLPKKNEEYPIFNEKIFSPIAGVVIKAENNIFDNKPYSGHYPYNTGNTVVIQKDNYYLLLGHMKQGSLVVKEGDFIQANELIGSAGNSGWTERPHLHMQLIKSDSPDYWAGIGISLQFRNMNLYKNRLIKLSSNNS